MASGTRPAVLTPALAARALGLVAALRRWCDAIESTARAVALDNGGALLLADGREYRPIVTTERRYLTRPTYEALAEVVGEERADEAFTATAASLKRAMVGAPAGSWKRLKDELEARGAVVVTAGEEWRRVWPAKLVEGGDDAANSVGQSERNGSEGVGRELPRVGGQVASVVVESSVSDEGATARSPVATSHSEQAASVVAGPGREAPARALCSVCGTVRAVNRKSGLVRAHPEQDTADYCKGSGKPPAAAAEQLKL